MNTKDWLQLNPNHRIKLSAEPDGLVRAKFYGGEGVDQRFFGVGANEGQACDMGLEVRAAIKSKIP